MIYIGDCLEVLRTLPSGSVQCCVTSPPYYGLRDYGVDGQLGREKTPQEFVENLVRVFREVRRVLKDDGTLWLNLGDSYARTGGTDKNQPKGVVGNTRKTMDIGGSRKQKVPDGLKQKDLIGIPWMVAFALRADGWYLRQDIIWAKPNPMPQSVTDRCTTSHEYIFLLSKSPKYYFDAAVIRNPPSEALLKQIKEGYNGSDTKDFAESGAQSASGTKARIIEGARKKLDKQRGHERNHEGFRDKWDAMTKAEQQALGSNKRDVWILTPTSLIC